MNKIIKIIGVIIFTTIILILAFVFIPTSSGRLINSTIIFFGKASCAIKRGSWEKAGFKNSCVFHYKDGGKLCKENSECSSKKCMIDVKDFFIENTFKLKDKSLIRLSRSTDGYILGKCLTNSYIGWYCEGAELQQPRKDTPDHGLCFIE